MTSAKDRAVMAKIARLLRLDSKYTKREKRFHHKLVKEIKKAGRTVTKCTEEIQKNKDSLPLQQKLYRYHHRVATLTEVLEWHKIDIGGK